MKAGSSLMSVEVLEKSKLQEASILALKLFPITQDTLTVGN